MSHLFFVGTNLLSRLFILGFYCFHFLLGTIEEFIDLSYHVLRSSLRSFHTDSPIRFNVTKDDVLWLGYHAFFKMLRKKQTYYSELILWLEEAMRTMSLAGQRMCTIVNGKARHFDGIYRSHY
jgi:hypothetical protein